jgi:Y-X(10)_GDL-associated radical SAM protein
MEPRIPARMRSEGDLLRSVPVHVVWELTLACNLHCQHCGSRAGKRRPGELNTQEALEVVESLARLGTRELSLIGGEAYLRKDWTDIVRAARGHGMYVAIQTGGWAFTPKRLEEGIAAGLQGVGVSIDGMAELHDRVRGVKGAFENALSVLRRARDAGINRSVNTQIGAETIPHLRELMHTVIDAGAKQWQIQLTVAMGNAVDHPELLLQPYRLHELIPLLAELQDEGERRGFTMIVGNNIGYFGPYEHRLRPVVDERVHWTGCAAGQTAMGIEADGTVKGCPSLPTVGYAGGNVRQLSVEDIWNSAPEIHFGRLRSVDDMWGFCRTCYYADVCRGGCTWTSHSLLGRPGNNPYCHYRVEELAKRGLRERVRKVEDAPGRSFAIGRFELVTEEIPADGSDAPGTVVSTSDPMLVPLLRKPIAGMDRGPAPEVGRLPPRLELCRACRCHIYAHEAVCPHCGADVAAARVAYEAERARALEAMARLETLMAGITFAPPTGAADLIGDQIDADETAVLAGD